MAAVTAYYGMDNGRWREFTGLREVVQARTADEVVSALEQVEDAVERQGLYAAGFVSYEAAPSFDPVFKAHEPGTAPLVWFGLFDTMEYIPLPAGGEPNRYAIGEWTPTVSRDDYERAIARIKELIARGETYQVNYTYRLRAPFTGDPRHFFYNFVRRQPTAYGAYLDIGGHVVCSASPELFYRLNGRTVELRPMKGTINRGCTAGEDHEQARRLFDSAKDRAENTMIVDMVRNDIGRVAASGSVCTPELFTIERYPTLWQMTSTVTAKTDASFAEIMGALFPGASITGAPKARTTGIIAELETTPRQVYTGAVGYLAPGRAAEFNIAIRTVLIDRDRGLAEYGVGGGIVWDSTSESEYRETQVKARVLFENRSGFSLLETMRWTRQEGYFLLSYHLDRLCDSADYFGYPYDEDHVTGMLETYTERFGDVPARVRLLLALSGDVAIEYATLDTDIPDRPVRLRLAASAVNCGNPLLYHKTTSRAVYENARRDMTDCDDVILFNERGEVTEATIANIVVALDGELVTPPVSSGLLAGTYRAWLLERGEIAERVIRIEDLGWCDAIFLINSVREWREAELIDETPLKTGCITDTTICSIEPDNDTEKR